MLVVRDVVPVRVLACGLQALDITTVLPAQVRAPEAEGRGGRGFLHVLLRAQQLTCCEMMVLPGIMAHVGPRGGAGGAGRGDVVSQRARGRRHAG